VGGNRSPFPLSVFPKETQLCLGIPKAKLSTLADVKLCGVML
jgi:hypothetical protein